MTSENSDKGEESDTGREGGQCGTVRPVTSVGNWSSIPLGISGIQCRTQVLVLSCLRGKRVSTNSHQFLVEGFS